MKKMNMGMSSSPEIDHLGNEIINEKISGQTVCLHQSHSSQRSFLELATQPYTPVSSSEQYAPLGQSPSLT
ncbi:hypothetical protein F444_13128 [Phytophthora nicotianae P1976]|uniref:Uncharacterized protein n=1 Tax=Phytophthora nicotianae P1976 TaxID=1317066 RepID=A0A080ZUS2_PHYNI|nr:hypothetical protein F444_13128 [Phytophthora nicotianae P1976]